MKKLSGALAPSYWCSDPIDPPESMASAAALLPVTTFQVVSAMESISVNATLNVIYSLIPDRTSTERSLGAAGRKLQRRMVPFFFLAVLHP